MKVVLLMGCKGNKKAIQFRGLRPPKTPRPPASIIRGIGEKCYW